MRGLTVVISIVFYIFVCIYFFLFPPVMSAEDSLGESVDCTDVSINYSDDPTLTRDERLRLMDKAFFESLNKFEMCQEAKKTAASAGASGGGAGGGGDGSEGGSGNSGGGNQGAATAESVASSTMSGTETPKEGLPSEGVEAEATDSSQSSQDMDESGKTVSGNMTRASGKLPEDIPSAANDDALAAQIRYAAENEPDPVKREQLWNEYRKYKGLPPKKK